MIPMVLVIVKPFYSRASRRPCGQQIVVWSDEISRWLLELQFNIQKKQILRVLVISHGDSIK